ncbi:50S ribosomal protein L29, chloroplastic [Rhodamnia argentea]|uniref:Large ribosomal subunit protein uL29c n=1 Tax=Rhodamnia argentea TaxID=178133 RepID=A0A8B8P130_9MYRT|nr:50S ribosomal protein L29, chloroplastic [Rhodamnia argentea]XP_030528260.1 50S ribosomal protein L29, chloroplastic [Rhodamnia argentea]
MLSLSVASPTTAIFSAKISLSTNPRSSSFSGVRIQHKCPPLGLPLATSSSSSSSRGRASSVVMMAKREEELKEIRVKTTEEINDEVVDLKGELLMLRLQKSARNEFKSSDFRRMRKRIARLLTVKREREIEEGINKRLSRKLDRRWKRSIVVRPPPSLKKLLEEEAAAEAEKSA